VLSNLKKDNIVKNKNQKILKIKEQIISNFTQENWEEIGLLTNTIDIIKGHDRLLRSLNWDDEDYAYHCHLAPIPLIG